VELRWQSSADRNADRLASTNAVPQGFLASVWKKSEVAAVPAGGLPLCKQALHWSRWATRLAREIETALGGLPAPEPGGEVLSGSNWHRASGLGEGAEATAGRPAVVPARVLSRA
jgi:hypothetical protein